MFNIFTDMNAKLTLFTALFLTHFSIGQIKDIHVGTSDIIHSKILDEKREFWVRLPVNYDKHSTRKYPVLYVLDGRDHFFSVTAMVDQLSENGNTIVPEMIVVGVLSTRDRTRDLTPTHSNGAPFMDSISCKDSGGNDKFIEFLVKELIPHINSAYAASSYRMLIGHSFGGLTAMNIILKNTDLFNDYIVIDPSIWWDNAYILGETIKNIKKINFKGRSMFLGIANTTTNYTDQHEIMLDTTLETTHIRTVFEIESLFSETWTKLNFGSKFYPNDTHSSVPLITTYDGLRFIFKNYELKIPLSDTLKIDSAFMTTIQTQSAHLYSTYGHRTPIPFDFIEECAYIALDSKMNKEALELFELNIKNFPTRWESYFDLGDYYYELSDFEKALKHYKKAYSMFHYFMIKSKIEETENIISFRNEALKCVYKKTL